MPLDFSQLPALAHSQLLLPCQEEVREFTSQKTLPPNETLARIRSLSPMLGRKSGGIAITEIFTLINSLPVHIRDAFIRHIEEGGFIDTFIVTN